MGVSMKNFEKQQQTLNVKDIPCAKCIKFKNILGLFDGGYCTRLCIEAPSARNICVKTQWYAEMCTMDALLEAGMK
jgi:hypothetical protein